MFSPMAVAYPNAELPTVQLSMSALPSPLAEARLRRATVLAVSFALHLLLALLLADTLTQRSHPQTANAMEVSLVDETRPPPSPPELPSPELRQLAQVQVTVPEFTMELPVEAPPISAAVIDELPASPPVGTAVVGPVRTSIELLRSVAISTYYPSQSLRLKEQGLVTNTFCVDANGKVISVQVTSSSGYKRLDEAAIRVTRDSGWKAGTLDGRPVESCAQHSLRFVLTRK
jgi:protein TonB